MLQEKVFKIRITEMKQRLGTEWAKLDHVVIAAAIRQWRRRLLQIGDACFVYLLLQYSAQSVVNFIQIWRIWRPQLRRDKFWSFFF